MKKQFKDNCSNKKSFIITGGNLNNKGAQAMLFITVSELRKHYLNCEIYMADEVGTIEEIRSSRYDFNRYSDGWLKRLYISSNMIIQFLMLSVLKGKLNKEEMNRYKFILKKTTAILDISGYGIGSVWSNKVNFSYILMLKLAKKFHVPVYLMPQSFGPFHYKGITGKVIKALLNRYLRYPRKIFARELDGLNQLSNDFHLNNITLAPDIVLNCDGLEFIEIKEKSNILTSDLLSSIYGVAIVPSTSNFRYNNKDQILNFYSQIIKFLISKGEKIVLLSHSREDLSVCNKIKDMFINEKQVIFIDKEISFWEFSNIVKRFKFMISSRFHSIVIGYKSFIPSIVMGWAIKYHELANTFDQEEFVVDVEKMTSYYQLISIVDRMLVRHKDQSMIIKSKMNLLEQRTCFDIIFDDIK